MNVAVELTRLALAIHHDGGRLLIVGGSVRDHFLGRTSKDTDCEVFGVPADRLLELLEGFGTVNCVGAAFGVFKLRTATDMELDISIPRRDSKSGDGHKGFTITGDSNMTIGDAARRRDFTMNAISFDPLTREFIDPFNGRADIANKIIRVVDPERFGDDSLRVLRAVQFSARFGFSFDPFSFALMCQIRLNDLPAERVWVEVEKVLRSDQPGVGLTQAGALGVIDQLFPELAALRGVEQDPEWHPEGTVWTHTLMVVDQARAFLNANPLSPELDITVMLAALCHDLGKPSTTRFIEGRWRSLGHEQAGVAPSHSLLTRLNVQTINGYDVRKQVLALVDQHLRPFEFFKVDPGPAAFRRLARKVDLNLLARVAEADDAGRHPRPADPSKVAWFRKRIDELDLRLGAPAPLLMGRHLIDLGMKPGPEIGRLTKLAYEAQLDGRVTTVAEGIAFALSATPPLVLEWK
jgi:tRNA nucleotidyltransferase (CCA-adding enzyme)